MRRDPKSPLIIGFCLVASSTLADVSTEAGRELERFKDCDVCPEMIVLPMGSFMMGSQPGESTFGAVVENGVYRPVRDGEKVIVPSETPRHRVEIDIPIAMARTEVTYDQWMACVADGGCNGVVPPTQVINSGPLESIPPSDHFITISGTHPVTHINFHDIQSYIVWLNEKASTKAYRLPTEAEWEYAARAGSEGPYAQGDNITSDQANFSGRMTAGTPGELRPDLVSRPSAVPVEDLDAANAWGLRHMSGNVEEITMSCRTSRLPDWESASKFLARQYDIDGSLVSCGRVTRGGNFDSHVSHLRTARRGLAREDSQVSWLGFRVVKELKSGE